MKARDRVVFSERLAAEVLDKRDGVERVHEVHVGLVGNVRDILAGLKAPQKRLSPKYLYDERGIRAGAAMSETGEIMQERTHTQQTTRMRSNGMIPWRRVRWALPAAALAGLQVRPVAGDERYFVVTHWEDQASFEAWPSPPCHKIASSMVRARPSCR